MGDLATLRSISATEQSQEAFARSARILRTYYEQLLAVGFDAQQALQITLAWQKEVLVMTQSKE